MYTLAKAYDLKNCDLSEIARLEHISLYYYCVSAVTIYRQGSGSACRSIYGGFVEWQQGEIDGTQSKAIQVILVI